MEALSGLHHRHQPPPCSSFHYYYSSSQTCPSYSSSLFLSPSSSSLSSSPSIRASSSPSPPPSLSDPSMQNHQTPELKSPQFINPIPEVSNFDQNLQYPEAESSQISNPIPKASTFDPHLQKIETPEAKSPQIFNPINKVSNFDQNLQYPEAKSSNISNPIPKASTFDPPLQEIKIPESKSPQFFNPLPKLSNFDQNLQYPEANSPQIFNLLPKFPSFVTITAVSAFLFLGFCQNGFTNKPITLLSSMRSIQETLNESSDIEEFVLYGSKPDHVQSILRLKLKEKLPIVHGFDKTRTDGDEAWQVLKAQVSSCNVELELVKVGFEEILEKDPCCSKEYHDRVLEYLEIVDECKSLLKGVKVAMDMCEKENRYVKYHLRFFNKVVARIRVLEGDMVGALKHFQELEQA